VKGPSDGSDRRRFFSEGLGWLVRPLAEYLDPRLDAPAVSRMRLRPPGAIPESDFLDTCYRCGTCVELCPADAILAVNAPADADHGTPYLDPDLAACALCEGLLCMAHCASGALKPVGSVHHIRMGLAVVSPAACVRTGGGDCRRCVEVCPIASTAIRIVDSGPPRVLDPGCIGCGQCQLACPTMPKAVIIRPV
jgi:MauM/NapG family ferredoxin protein